MTADAPLRTAAALALILVASAIVSVMLWRLARSRMRRERWMGVNYRGQRIVATSGLLVVAIGVASASVVAALARRATGWFVFVSNPMDRSSAEMFEGLGPLDLIPIDALHTPTAASATGAAATALALMAFGLLGYRDDTRGGGDASGFVAHFVRSLRRRRLTTGAQKALGGGAAALLSVQVVLFGNVAALWASTAWSDGYSVMRSLGHFVIGSHESWAVMPWLRGSAVVALGANLLNLLDRAPGRATKAALAWWLCGLAPVAVFGPSWPQGFQFAGVGTGGLAWQSPALWAAGAVGAAVGLLRSELAETHMLGDTGVNPLGAALGLATVAMSPASVEWVVLIGLAVLNLASERWSFSQIIDAVPPLRWLDRLGSPYRR